MYDSPQSICVAAFVRQSAPATAILLPGSACGMPYAPLEALYASARQLDSRVHSRTRHWNSPLPQPYRVTASAAYAFAAAVFTITPGGGALESAPLEQAAAAAARSR